MILLQLSQAEETTGHRKLLETEKLSNEELEQKYKVRLNPSSKTPPPPGPSSKTTPPPSRALF